jgi:nitric oxide dioxygenase
MGFVNKALAQIGLPEEYRHFEFFGPFEALD